MKSIIDDYKKEVNPNFEVEIESVPNDVQYFQKLSTYIAGNQLPDIFKIPNELKRQEQDLISSAAFIPHIL